MATAPKSLEKKKSDSTGTIGVEANLWRSAYEWRNNMNATEYKQVVLGLNILKYISEVFVGQPLSVNQ